MRSLKNLLLAGLALAASMAAVAPAAHAEDMTWTFNNQTGSEVNLRFYNADRSRVWPSDKNRVYFVSPYATQSFTLACDFVGQNVCYGGKPADDNSSHWGIGIKGGYGCDSCCVQCSSNFDPNPINLTNGDDEDGD